MLSSFMKKLLFARQLFMVDGRIHVLGTDQIMLPSDIVVALQSLDEKRYYAVVKEGIKNNMREYTRRIGATSSGMLKITEDIFEMYGLGKPEIVVLDQKKKTATVRFHAPSVVRACQNQKVKECVLLPAALAGMFSFLFAKDVDCEMKGYDSKGALYEYWVR